MPNSQSPIAAACFPIGILLLGIPFAATTITFAHVFVPEVTLRSKEIKIGPTGTTTLDLGPLGTPNDAVAAAAYISIISSILCATGLVLGWVLRGASKSLLVRRTTMGLAVANVLGQVACLAAWGILQGKDDAKVPSEGTVRYVDGKYETNGRLFFTEAWSCTMEKYFAERENWASKACADLRTARDLTAALVICALLIMGLTYWQIHEQGGLSFAFGRRDMSQRFTPVEDDEHSLTKRSEK